jgi:hypothetical protein
MLRRLLFAPLLILTALPLARAAESEEGFTPIFDGKTLEGWEGSEKMFKVADGAIVAGTLKEEIPRNEFLCTKKQYENFELRLEVKLVPAKGNAGIQFRTKRIPNHHEVSGYQADVGEGWWGKLYDESRRNKVLAGDDNKLGDKLKKEDWNEYVIRAEGKHIQLWVNGVQTVDYTEKEENIDSKGIIAVQIHGGGPAECWYRKIRIKELK